MTKFVVYNYFHIICEKCKTITEVKPGSYEMITSKCKCNEIKEEKPITKKKVKDEK